MELTLTLFVCFLFSSLGYADPSTSHTGTPAEISRVLVRNAQAMAELERAPAPAPIGIPVPEYADFKYLLISADHFNEDAAPKRQLVQNLPKHIILIVLAAAGTETSVRTQFARWINTERLRIISASSIYGAFWARDAFPFPVFKNGSGSEVRLIGAQYIRPFYGQDIIAKTFKTPLDRQSFTFVGGNLMSDEEGRCFTVDGPRSYGVSASALQKIYQCREVISLPHVSGIGDVDEVIKVLPGKKILTNTASYVKRLSALGYEVIRLPSLTGNRTYANSVLLGKTAFVPIYGLNSDEEARKVYEAQGYTFIGINSRTLSDAGKGSLHCMTMAYPDMDEKVLLFALSQK